MLVLCGGALASSLLHYFHVELAFIPRFLPFPPPLPETEGLTEYSVLFTGSCVLANPLRPLLHCRAVDFRLTGLRGPLPPSSPPASYSRPPLYGYTPAWI